MAGTPGIPSAIPKKSSHNFTFSQATGHQILLFRRRPPTLVMTKMKGVEGHLLRVTFKNKLLGYSLPEEGGLFYGIFRKNELIGIGFQPEQKGPGRPVSHFQFTATGELEPILRLARLKFEGRFRVVWEGIEGTRGGKLLGDRVVALIVEEHKQF